MAFKTFTPGAILPASDVNTYLMNQAVIVCTSTTRPASPVQGMTIYETDTNRMMSYNGSAWLPGTKKPSFNAYNAAMSTSFASGATSAITSGLTVGEDTDAGWAAGTGTYTIQTPGLWMFKVWMTWAASAAGARIINWGGTSLQYYESMSASVDSSGRMVSTILDRFVATNTITPQLSQTSGGALNLNAFAFTGVWLGA